MFTGLIWPPAVKYSDGILSLIKKQFAVTCEPYSLETIAHLKKFIVGTYKPDRTPMKRVMSKYKAMRKHKRIVNVIYIKLDNPKMIAHKKTRLLGTYYCQEMKLLKRKIRDKFKGKIKRYVHDIVIHISDNDDCNKRTERLLRKFAQRVNQ